LSDTSGNVAINLVATYKALGGGWEIRAGKDFVPEETMEQMRTRTNWGGLLAPEDHGADAHPDQLGRSAGA